MITIDKESKERIRLSVDLDKFTQRYKTDSGYYEIPSPSLWTIEKNLWYLLKNSTEKTFEQKYKMKPDYLSQDEYGTPALAQLLMYVNGVFCLENFDLHTVVIPSYESIITLCRDKFPTQSTDEMTTVEW